MSEGKRSNVSLPRITEALQYVSCVNPILANAEFKRHYFFLAGPMYLGFRYAFLIGFRGVLP